MYIYQNGKLYTQDGDKLVGVEIYSDKIILLEETVKLSKEHEILTPLEVKCRFNPQPFPTDEVVDNEPITTTKRVARKSTSK